MTAARTDPDRDTSRPLLAPEACLMHDFRAKLSDGSIRTAVEGYLERARDRRLSQVGGEESRESCTASGSRGEGNGLLTGPISINLDLTMACDYACDHCIDHELLNTGLKFDYEKIVRALALMREGGLRSVILIGGGEPTLYPRFEDVVAQIKALHLQCAVVSNGAHNERIARVAEVLEPGDWVRLSLDSGSDPTFQALHRPRRAITLARICELAQLIKERNPRAMLGFSFIVMWEDESQLTAPVVANVEEMAMAAQLAKEHRFDYISFKPMLVRSNARAEIINIGCNGQAKSHRVSEEVLHRIRVGLRDAEALGSETFRVVPSKNLIALLQQGGLERFGQQPRECHMQHFRQVLTPAGIYSCPAHRGNPLARINSADGYATPEVARETLKRTSRQIERFNAAEHCREITCIYNETNWWVEELITARTPLESRTAPDFFL